MWKKCIILIGIGLTLILLQYISLRLLNNRQKQSERSYLNIDSINKNADNSINIGFSAFEFEQAKLEEIKLKNEYDLTAVLLHWKRLNGVQNTLQYLLHTHLFKQIIIWNNNPHINLTFYDLIKNNDSKKFVRIINSKENLKDKAKYRACAEAKTRACFYVDDDWNISHYLKSLIASFRSDPNLLHSVTGAYTFYTNLVWSYFDREIDLHSGFSWIGCGSVFLRQHAQHHLQLIQKFLQNHTSLISLSDAFFSIWLNDISVQMNTNIRYQASTSNGSVSFSLTPHFANLEYASSVLAIRILEHSLRFDRTTNNSVEFPRQQNRRFPYYVKSPSMNDDFIFYTNILPYQLQEKSFNISQDFQRGTRRNLPRDPNAKYFSRHSTSATVDDDLSTCWHTSREIHSNDFFALDFLYIQTNVVFTVAVAHSPQLQKTLDISISFDGLQWLSYRSQNGIYTKKNRTAEEHLHTFLFDSSEFNPGFQSFRYLSFKAIKESDHHFHVCEVQMISEKKFIRIRRDFHQINM